jgi:hypothetical protein
MQGVGDVLKGIDNEESLSPSLEKALSIETVMPAGGLGVVRFIDLT